MLGAIKAFFASYSPTDIGTRSAGNFCDWWIIGMILFHFRDTDICSMIYWFWSCLYQKNTWRLNDAWFGYWHDDLFNLFQATNFRVSVRYVSLSVIVQLGLGMEWWAVDSILKMGLSQKFLTHASRKHLLSICLQKLRSWYTYSWWNQWASC